MFQEIKTCSVAHVELGSFVDYNIAQLDKLISTVAPLTGLETLTLDNIPQRITEIPRNTTKVKKFVMKRYGRINDIIALTHYLDPDQVVLENGSSFGNNKVRFQTITDQNKYLS